MPAGSTRGATRVAVHVHLAHVVPRPRGLAGQASSFGPLTVGERMLKASTLHAARYLDAVARRLDPRVSGRRARTAALGSPNWSLDSLSRHAVHVHARHLDVDVDASLFRCSGNRPSSGPIRIGPEIRFW